MLCLTELQSGDTAVLIACKNVCTEECVQWLECMRAMLELGGVEALRTANKDGESPLQVALTSSVSSYLRKSLLEAVVGVCYSAKTKTMDLQEMQLSDFSGQLLATLGGFTIKTLDLRKNRFRMLPLNLGTVLPKLDRILLDGNPLDLLPEHARHSWHKLSNYFDSVTMRSLSFNERKVMVVGEEATGERCEPLLSSLSLRSFSCPPPTLCGLLTTGRQDHIDKIDRLQARQDVGH